MISKAKIQSKPKKVATLKNTENELKKKIPYINLLYASLLLNILLMIVLFVSQNNIPPEVPLFYGYPGGEDQLTQKTSLVIPPLISIAVITLNSLIAYFSKDDYIKKTLIITGFVITLLNLLTTIKIVFLVGSF